MLIFTFVCVCVCSSFSEPQGCSAGSGLRTPLGKFSTWGSRVQLGQLYVYLQSALCLQVFAFIEPRIDSAASQEMEKDIYLGISKEAPTRIP